MSINAETVLNCPSDFIVCKNCQGINYLTNIDCVHCEQELDDSSKNLSRYNSLLTKIDHEIFDGVTQLTV